MVEISERWAAEATATARELQLAVMIAEAHIWHHTPEGQLEAMRHQMQDASDDVYFEWFDKLTRDEQCKVLGDVIAIALFDCGFEVAPERLQEGVPARWQASDVAEFVLRRRRWRGKVDLAAEDTNANL